MNRAAPARPPEREPWRPRCPDRRGSTTKTFTAVVVLQLVAAERLGLGDLVARRLPDLAVPSAGTLTVQHLLRMRSGLFDFEDHPSLLGDVGAHLRPHTLAEVLALGLDGPPAFAPGERFAYWTGGDWVDVTHQFFGRGDGALISTVGDLSRFFRALLGGRLLPAALLDRMRTVVPDDPPARVVYGLGLIANPADGC